MNIDHWSGGCGLLQTTLFEIRTMRPSDWAKLFEVTDSEESKKAPVQAETA
jgi:hypothetical protein